MLTIENCVLLFHHTMIYYVHPLAFSRRYLTISFSRSTSTFQTISLRCLGSDAYSLIQSMTVIVVITYVHRSTSFLHQRSDDIKLASNNSVDQRCLAIAVRSVAVRTVLYQLLDDFQLLSLYSSMQGRRESSRTCLMNVPGDTA